MSCRTSSYFSSIVSAIAVLPAPCSPCLEARHLPHEARLLGEERFLRLPARPGQPFLDLRHARLERLPPQLAHALLGREALRGHPLDRDLRHQPPRVLVELGED